MNSSKKNAGYLLLEALIGVSILAIVLVSIFYVLSASLNSFEEMKKESIAITLAQKKMEEVSGFDYLVNEQGDFSPNFPDYKFDIISMSLKTVHMYTLANVKLNVTYEVKKNPRTVVLETNLLLRKGGVN